MKVVILAGGFGTRLGEETHLRPKPMIEIGEMPILWHIMKKHGKYATLTAVQPLGRFGALGINSKSEVINFQEKPKGDKGWINGGFLVLEPEIFGYIEGDHTVWEREPLENLAKDGQLMAYKHNGFWMCMDTLRDKNELERLWNSGNPPWKIWKD